MIDLEYTASPQETAKATLDFLTNRPLMALMMYVMKGACLVLCLGFIIVAINHAIKPQDVIGVIIAVAWLFFYKTINRSIIARILKMRKFENIKCLFRFDDKSILYKAGNATPQHIEWKKLKFLLKNQDGYIVPLTGAKNAGRFLWLPERSFSSATNKQEFLTLVEKFKLKIKNIAN